MKAIAINGSPRPGGNTEILLRKLLEPLEAAGWSTSAGSNVYQLEIVSQFK
jgi:multimeric flavodoxin WrbA